MMRTVPRSEALRTEARSPTTRPLRMSTSPRNDTASAETNAGPLALPTTMPRAAISIMTRVSLGKATADRRLDHTGRWRQQRVALDHVAHVLRLLRRIDQHGAQRRRHDAERRVGRDRAREVAGDRAGIGNHLGAR